MSDTFYRAFEDRHRGSFELIQSRLKIYLPFLLPLLSIEKEPFALDLGCGRGEWLDLLQKNGFNVKGVDINESMLQECRKRNLDTHHGDAIAYLKTLKSESVSLVSAFHFVEHIPFDSLRELTVEAYRILRPGGLLILETPNSENLQVGTSSFYLDPTHQHPIPSPLLSFVVEYANFERIKPIFLQEPYRLNEFEHIGLQHVIEGVSCDYAIVSQKNARASILKLFNGPFELEYGTRLIPLAKLYDDQIIDIHHKLENSLNTIEVLKNRLDYYDNFFEKAQLNNINLEFTKREKRSLALIQKLRLSNIKSLLTKATHKSTTTIKKIIKKILRIALSNQFLREKFLVILNKFPNIKQKIRNIALRLGVLQNLDVMRARKHANALSSNIKNQRTNAALTNVSPQAYRTCMKLTAKTVNKEKVNENSY